MEDTTFPTCPTAGINSNQPIISILNLFAQRKDEASFFEENLQITSKEDYLALRAKMKAWLRAYEASQRHERHLARQPGGNSTAQVHLAMAAPVITGLIELRRAGKVWSWGKRQTQQTLAA